jgi:hypothetical protein
MLFAIDIDGTIAGAAPDAVRIHYMNRALKLGLSETRLAEFGSYRAFAQSSEVQMWGAIPSHQKSYMNALEQAQWDADIQRSRLPIPGALEAIHALTQQGHVIYVTCRRDTTGEITQGWLARYDFPHPGDVYHCSQYYEKYRMVYAHASPREHITLIDNQARDLILSYKGLVLDHREIAQSLLRRLILVAFGEPTLPPLPTRLPVPVVALDSWDQWQDKLEHPTEYRTAFWQQRKPPYQPQVHAS